jgi:hypothetical protein
MKRKMRNGPAGSHIYFNIGILKRFPLKPLNSLVKSLGKIVKIPR